MIGRELLFSALLPCQFRLPLSQVINAIPLSTYHRTSETVYSSAFQTGDRLCLTYHLICHLSPITYHLSPITYHRPAKTKPAYKRKPMCKQKFQQGITLVSRHETVVSPVRNFSFISAKLLFLRCETLVSKA